MHHPTRISRADNIFVHPISEKDEQHVSSENQEQTVHRLALKNLPSRDMSIVSLPRKMTTVMKRKMTAVESYKLRKGSSSLYRRISEVDVGLLCEVLVNKKQSREATLHDLKSMNARLEIKKVIKYQVLKDSVCEEEAYTWYNTCVIRFQKVVRCLMFCLSLLRAMELWKGHMKKIRGHYGSEVASFFIFLRWLLYLNVLNVVIMVCFVVVPQSTPVVRAAQNMTHNDFHFADVFTGDGYVSKTLLYYGQYSAKTVAIYGSQEYDLPLAYILTVCGIGLLNLALITKELSSAYLQSYLVASKLKHGFCNKLFCSWDYGIETEDASELQKQSIFQELTEILGFRMVKDIKWTSVQNWIRIISFVLGNIFALCLLAGSGILVYYILLISAVQVTIPFLNLITLPVTVTLILLALHYAFCFLFSFEEFNSSETHLYYIIVRVALMRCGILAVLSYFWMELRMPVYDDMNCYENSEGQEIYRLIVFNFFVTSFLYTVSAYLWKKLTAAANLIGYKLNAFEFDVSFWTNSLIYYQTLTWIGLLYSPLLPVLTVVILFLIFHSTLHQLRDNCKPSKIFLSTAESRTAYLSVTLMCFLLSSMAVFYSLFFVKPSSTCGPFVGQPIVFSIVYSWWTKFLKDYHSIMTVINVLESPSLLVTVFTALCVGVHYARAYANMQEQILNYVKLLLLQEGKDKAFLLNLYEQELSKNMLKHSKGEDAVKKATTRFLEKLQHQKIQ